MIARREAGLLRLVALGLVGPDASTSPVDVVRRLLAVQAQDLPGALTSVALRTGARDRAAVTAALDEGLVVRGWPMRGTLHLVAADDLPWLLPLAGPRMEARSAPLRRDRGLDDGTLAKAGDLAREALADGALSRADLAAAWERGGVGTAQGRGYLLLVHLSQTGAVCLGPTAPDGSGEQLVVAADRWLPEVGAVERDEALARLAWRYLSSHGPATVADLVRWSSLTVGEVRRGVAAVRDRLVVVELEGREGVEHLMDPSLPDRLQACRAEAEGVLLLPGFDEYLLGYADRDAVLAPEHAERIVPGRNGVFRPTVVVAGQVRATWKGTPARRDAAAGMTVEWFEGDPPTDPSTDPPTVAEAVARAHALLP